jgi:hypothetical protein
VGRPLWREDRSVFCICCWPLPVQSFSGLNPLVIGTIFYCLSLETSLFVASYDSQGHGGGIRLRLHMGAEVSLPFKWWKESPVWGSGGIAPPFLILVPDGGEWSASHSGHFTPRMRAPCYTLYRRLGRSGSCEGKCLTHARNQTLPVNWSA